MISNSQGSLKRAITLVTIIRLRPESESYAKCDGNIGIENPGQQYNFFQMRCDFVIRLKAQAVQLNKCGFISEHLGVAQPWKLL